MNYPIFDGHCDTISEIFEKGGNINKNNFHIDFERMEKYSRYVQVFAMFVDKKQIKTTSKEYIEKLLKVYKKEIENSPISHCETIGDVENSKFSSILSIEGGEALDGKIENLEKFYNDGVRIMTLTWNYKNEIADGIEEDDSSGLTDFGKTVVKKMNELGMVVDVSHLSEKGFWDVAKISEKPFIASHSNVKEICGHKRNLDNEQIKEIIRKNGIIGMNFYPLFLDNSGQCQTERILDHIDYILNLGGENNIGIGSDFDGVSYLPHNMTGIESIEKLISLMEKRGYSKEIIKKITFDNFMRVLRENFN